MGQTQNGAKNLLLLLSLAAAVPRLDASRDGVEPASDFMSFHFICFWEMGVRISDHLTLWGDFDPPCLRQRLRAGFFKRGAEDITWGGHEQKPCF